MVTISLPYIEVKVQEQLLFKMPWEKEDENLCKNMANYNKSLFI
jgi:hypothetical protein